MALDLPLDLLPGASTVLGGTGILRRTLHVAVTPPRYLSDMVSETRDHADADYEWLRQADHQASQDYDKAILTLSTGALAISLIFIDNVAPHPHDQWAVIASWALFTASILAIVTSLVTSQIALREEMTRLERRGPESAASKATAWLSWLAGGLFVLGIAFLTTFASLNV